ncbi:RELT-like protein 2 [Erinaceus europaeus]|uniref:RELT-like protein 2 n=1 Tax=Erinaceus europaeus TaxID=9365 RepID=A0A1S3W5U0_ERIEU|nr:RELT-like protein 2 [Erinaceus europaeus]XP_016041853.2 RELT-like protein 2 [Erinaceus europaeus]XP_060036034.1 RELT-like protein 2 [Erinaceus europaeus]XP_060036045.1 RELT-like protein 2 [Erinaceus europaeus]XP_060036048.1 RELT-like protein 2 [Erinaceus europaeus]XP_060036058.1 RELT-like protein 2 [Erinaceus europaeus]
MSEPQPDLEPPQHGLYMLFLLVLVFFLMGLVGFMICHVLKKKGYRCRTSRGSEPDDAQLQPAEDDDMNEDTVERIVRCIIQNEANAEALKEMLGDSEGEGTVQLSSVDATSSLQDGAPSHHHTVHLGSAAPCIHCSRNKRPPLVRQGRSKEGKSRPRPGETTVFSVGRFRVTHIEKRYGLHEHRDGSPTDRSWGSGGGQDPGGGQGSGGGQPRAGTPVSESQPPERPQLQTSSPVQNGGLRESSLVPCAFEGNTGASAEPILGIRGRDTSPGPASQEASGQSSKSDTSDHQVSPPREAGRM